MLKKLLIYTLIAVFLVQIGMAITCYQESANISTSCGGLDSGVYKINDTSHWVGGGHNLIDGNMLTYDTANPRGAFYVNYSKNSLMYGAIVRMNTTVNNTNVTIPDICFDYYPNKLSMLYISIDSAEDVSYIYCFDGISAVDGGFKYIGSVEKPTTGAHNFTEENIFWNVSYLDNCTDTNTYSLNFSIFNEQNPADKITSNFEIEIFYSINGSYPVQYVADMSGKDNYEICIDTNVTYVLNSTILYNSSNGFAHRWYLYNLNISNDTLQYYIYNFDTTSGITNLVLQVLDEDYVSYPNVIVHMQRKYIGEGVWRTVQVDQSDEFGNTVFHVIE
jgi:hypothetical protein